MLKPFRRAKSAVQRLKQPSDQLETVMELVGEQKVLQEHLQNHDG
jgi:hypothetical protein